MSHELHIEDDSDFLRECEEVLQYQFQDLELLQAALTHASGANTRLASNERMEFLGDSVLGLVTCELLYLRFPEYEEGDMTKIKSEVVSRRTCASFSREMGLGDFLILGRGLDQHVHMPSNILADVFESLVGAIFLDGGLDPARDFILRFLEPEVERVAEGARSGSTKSTLQQVAQRELGSTPQYLLLDEKGPDHSKCFKIAVRIAGLTYPGAWGRNKKEAEQRAAMNALAQVQGEPIPFEHD